MRLTDPIPTHAPMIASFEPNTGRLPPDACVPVDSATDQIAAAGTIRAAEA